MEISGRQMLAVPAGHEGRSPGPRVIPGAETLYLDDVGPEIGEDLAASGPGQDARELEDAEAREGLRSRHGAVQKKACSPVWARPRMSACTSCVPS